MPGIRQPEHRAEFRLDLPGHSDVLPKNLSGRHTPPPWIAYGRLASRLRRETTHQLVQGPAGFRPSVRPPSVATRWQAIPLTCTPGGGRPSFSPCLGYYRDKYQCGKRSTQPAELDAREDDSRGGAARRACKIHQ